MTMPEDHDRQLALIKRQLFDLEQEIRVTPMLDTWSAQLREQWANALAAIRNRIRSSADE